MKKLYILATISLIAVNAIAQPTINKLFDYQPGDEYQYKKIQAGTVIDTSTIPTIGANLTWNFTSLQFDPQIYVNTIIDLASSIYPNNFAGCTYVFQEYTGIQQFYRKSGDTVLYMGNSYSTAEFTPNPPVIKFPGNYGSANNNVYGPMDTYVPGLGTWTYVGRYNAYGTLQLPGNTLTNLALYITHGGNSALSFTDYMWCRANEVSPLFRIQFRHQGGNTTIEHAYATPEALSVNDVTKSKLDVSLSPNPVTDKLTIIAKEALASVSVYDVSGRVLLSQVVTGTNTTVDTEALPTGIYFVKLTGEDGSTETNRIVKEN